MIEGLEVIYKPRDLAYNGKVITTQPKLVNVIAKLLSGDPVSCNTFGWTRNTLAVYMAVIRRILHENKIPYTVSYAKTIRDDYHDAGPPEYILQKLGGNDA